MPTQPLVYASPLYVPKYRAFSAAGIPLAGGSVGVYIAGTVTPFNTFPTYADALAGSNVNVHPVLLDANGEANIFVPVTSVLLKVVLRDSGGVVQWTEDYLHPGVAYPGVAGAPFTSGWRPISDVTTAPFSFASAVSFTVNGDDVTSTFHVGRRVQTINTGGTVTSTVTASLFAGNTTVTLVNDAGVLDAGLSQVFYSVVPYSPSAYLDPRSVFTATRQASVQTNFAGVNGQKVATFTVTLNTNGEWVGASNHWLCKYPGNYLIQMQFGTTQTAGTNIPITLNIADTSGLFVYARSLGLSAPTINLQTTHHVHMTKALVAGDTVAMYVIGDASTTAPGNNDTTRISITRIP